MVFIVLFDKSMDAVLWIRSKCAFDSLSPRSKMECEFLLQIKNWRYPEKMPKDSRKLLLATFLSLSFLLVYGYQRRP